MERFAFKIDAALRANLYKICRLCGIDNPSKVPILPMESEIIDLDEPSLSQKVYELVGFTVSQDDKMPQTMCSLCVDKINDFFEFREMCHATNKQTRKLLGLKQADPQTLMDVKPIFKSEPLPTGNKRGRKRKTEDNAKPTNSSELSLDAVKHEPVAWRKKQRLQQQQLLPASKTEIKEEPTDADGSLLGKKRRKASCSVCSERFASKEEAEEHRAAAHVPSIARYSCYACNQTHHNASDIKAHQLWHKLSKTPYQCPQCNASVANNYAFTRHLREHTPTTPIGLLVLDRECPLCKKTFLTNYFYNTHPCARRTRKCGGCSRPLNTEVAYMRHAPHCPKIYLSHSKHIMPEVSDHEAQMRIKNEYDVDNEESPAIENAAQSDMQPVVVLERLTSPLLRASLEPNSLGRNNERVSTKSYLKRVDQLLKNTMSTLVSIKHEPEVHIDDTGPQLQPVVEPTESEPDEEPPADYDDFRNDDSDDDESAAATAPDDDAPSVATAADDDAPAAATAADDDAPPADAPTVAVKQEIIDEAYEQQQLGDGVQIKQEPLKLKLKITKNHGQLNSSIVDDDDNDLQLQSKSAKKKKKRKHKERYRESEEATPSAENTDNASEMPTSSSAMVTIKQERVDENYEDVAQQAEFEPQATVMTSIPMLQLESSSFTEEQPAATSSSRESESEDVKPNRLELDRLMQITHIASGVAMAEEAMPPENAVEAVPNEAPAENAPKTARKSTSAKSTARKSTGGIPRPATSSSSTPVVEMQLPQIVAVESGATMPFNIAIKPEPLNRGYADEHEEQTEEEQMAEATSEINHNEKVDEEAAYINNLDLSNVVIKQEKDLHISDVDINGSEADNLQCNGSRASEESDDDDDDDDDSASSADEAEENMDTYEEQDERIYQEIELPPLEEQAAVENAEVEEPCESEQMQVEPENTSVLEEASEIAQEQPQDPPVEPQVTEAEKVESQPMQVESEAENENVENENVENVEGTANTAVEATAILESSAEEEKSIAAEETPPATQPEPELAASSAPAFNFVITSVCSQAEETLPVDEPQTPEKSSHSEENVTCPEVNLSAPKESETLAQPFFDPSTTSTNYNCDEEQQNVLNHELSASEQAEEQLALPAVEEQQEMEAGTSSATPSCSENASSANEETENRINEQQQEHQRHERQQQQQQRCEINDDSNINEIAENNNNANIERELNDDANVAPQENPNI